MRNNQHTAAVRLPVIVDAPRRARFHGDIAGVQRVLERPGQVDVVGGLLEENGGSRPGSCPTSTASAA
jgi:hypothetical protein